MMRCYYSSLIFAYALRKRFEALKNREPSLLGLGEIDADKSMRLLDKLWEKRPDLNTEKNGGSILQLGVERDFNDKHGHRIAFPMTGPLSIDGVAGAKPVLEAIGALDDVLSPSAKIFARRTKRESWGEITVLEPQVDAANLTFLIREGLLTRSDMAFLEHFGHACANLSEREMIALGRHETAEGTYISLQWELDRWRQWIADAFAVLTSAAEIGEKEATRASFALWQCWSFARESIIKSGVLGSDAFLSDQKAYADALHKLHSPSSGTDPSILMLLGGVQSSPNQIWSDPRVDSLKFPAFCCWSFSCYFIGTLARSSTLQGVPLFSRLSSLGKKEILDAFFRVRQCMNVKREMFPRYFSTEWLDNVCSELPGEVNADLNPENVWNGSKDLVTFIRGAQAVVNWIIENYVVPNMTQSRIQKN